ncbi:hypothetical protein F6X40_10100 [Paraburkholderia sp. UCT31]|uniref:hypothetical protein n=1 Tax=Paraburkholderia sp. UCT31 TaxID=2615209 RepID=UPI001654FA12|nr:hypothetical protein [Paraburkholderia sp. UCT31]MBC8737159.1 hypothetical protein [Paraburkholderia sp. UCT31]
MVEKIMGKVFVKVSGYRDIRQGDIFRAADFRGGKGPILRALTDAIRLPSTQNPEHHIWRVDVESYEGANMLGTAH